MKKSKIPTTPGTAFGGGFYAGRINIDGDEYALIVAPKKDGEHADGPWNESTNMVKGALSFYDGLANTKAMAKAGSKLANWARGLKIGGNSDWYLPSQDELEICYRHLKPTTDANTHYNRSGLNISAVPPTYPYSVDSPKQTKAKAFRAGGAEAFDGVWYWSSTQYAGSADWAWMQLFSSGNQLNTLKVNFDRARAVRRIKI